MSNSRNNKGFQTKLNLQSLEDRTVPTVFATFVNGTLNVFGDNLDNTITVSRGLDGQIRC